MVLPFECEVCFERTSERLLLDAIRTGNGDTLRASDCNHPICLTCTAKYVASRVEQGRAHGVRCAHVGCCRELFEIDVRNLGRQAPAEVTPAVVARFAELRAVDYATRIGSLAEEADKTAGRDDALLEVLWESARLCPRCSLMLEHGGGCNHFYCACGHSFDWAAAPRVLGQGERWFGCAFRLAQSEGLALSEATKYRGSRRLWRKASKLACQLGVSVDEAWAALGAAQGDSAEATLARERIRAGRAQAATASEATTHCAGLVEAAIHGSGEATGQTDDVEQLQQLLNRDLLPILIQQLRRLKSAESAEAKAPLVATHAADSAIIS